MDQTNSQGRAATFFVSLLIVMSSASSAGADSITSWGQAVDGIGSELGIGLPLKTLDSTPDGVANPTPNWIKYFLPLTETVSGTYGVNGVGMSADQTSSGCGPSAPDRCGHLNIYLKFAPTSEFPLQNAVVSTEFYDIDLKSVNHPSFFVESVQFFAASGQPVSPEFTNIAGQGSTAGVDWSVYQPTRQKGANWPVYIDFSGPGLADLITDPFWLKLTLRTAPFSAAGPNTAEYLRSSLTTVSIPEPSRLLLFATGLLSLGVAGLATKREWRARRPSRRGRRR
jgi:hypothetical protein